MQQDFSVSELNCKLGPQRLLWCIFIPVAVWREPNEEAEESVLHWEPLCCFLSLWSLLVKSSVWLVYVLFTCRWSDFSFSFHRQKRQSQITEKTKPFIGFLFSLTHGVIYYKWSTAQSGLFFCIPALTDISAITSLLLLLKRTLCFLFKLPNYTILPYENVLLQYIISIQHPVTFWLNTIWICPSR